MMQNMLNLVEIENEIKFADISKIFVKNFNIMMDDFKDA